MLLLLQNTKKQYSLTASAGASLCYSYICKCGNIVVLSAYFGNMALPAQWGEVVLATLPDECRVTSMDLFATQRLAGGAQIQITMNTRGQITLQNLTNVTGDTGYFGFSFTYPV